MSKPIIFTGTSPAAILAGTKTMTRRVIPLDKQAAALSRPCESPYGQVGDRLWVKETWAMSEFWCEPETQCVAYRSDLSIHVADKIYGVCELLPFKIHDGILCDGNAAYVRRWKSPRYMYRWASRITLEITSLGVERLQEISKEDAIAEGTFELSDKVKPRGRRIRIGPCEFYREHWDLLNAKRGYPWAGNPLVQVIGFKMIEEPD